MIDVGFYLFLTTCLIAVGWAMAAPRRLVSAPFQIAATSLFFVIPQLYILVNNKSLAPDKGLMVYVWYSWACLISTILGYGTIERPLQPHENRFSVRFQSLQNITTVTSILGIGGTVSLTIYLKFFPVTGLWTGWPVYLYTLSKFVVSGLILTRILSLSTGAIRYFAWSILLALPMLNQSLVNGRRAWTFLLAFAWFLPAILLEKIKIRPFYGIVGIALAFLIIVLFPAYRDYARKEGYSEMWRQIQQRPPSAILDHYFSGSQTLEIRDACVLTGIVHEYGVHSFGTRIFNRLLKHYVPGSLIGRDFKSSLYFQTPDYEKYESNYHTIANFSDESVRFYTAKTGFFDSYAEFSLFGVLLYFAMGRIYRSIEDSCFERKDVRAVFFMSFLGFLPAATVFDEWANTLTLYIPNIAILVICLRFAMTSNSDQIQTPQTVQPV